MWINFHPFYYLYLKIKNKLLCSIIYTDDILNNIQNINNILSKIPNYNIVKLFLNIELEKTYN
jgi:hypothetical protein